MKNGEWLKGDWCTSSSIRYTVATPFVDKGGSAVADMQVRSSSRTPGVLTVAELLDRIHPEPAPVPPVPPVATISVDNLLRREGRAPLRRPGPLSAALADPRIRCSAAGAGALLATGAVIGVAVFTDASGGNDPLGVLGGTQPGQGQQDRPAGGPLSTGGRATIIEAAAARSATADPGVASASDLAGLALPPAAAGPAPASTPSGADISRSAASGGTTPSLSGSTVDADAGSGAGTLDAGSTPGADSGPDGDGASPSSDESDPPAERGGSGSDDDQPTDSVREGLGSVGDAVSGAVGSGTQTVGTVLESATGTVDVVTETTGDVLDDTSDLLAGTTDPVPDLIDTGERTSGTPVGQVTGTTSRTAQVAAEQIEQVEQPDVDTVVDAVIPANKHHKSVPNEKVDPTAESDSAASPRVNSALSSLDNMSLSIPRIIPNTPN